MPLQFSFPRPEIVGWPTALFDVLSLDQPYNQFPSLHVSLGVIAWPEQAVNFAFGGADLRTLLCCAHTSLYTLRVAVPGNPHPWYERHRL